MRFASFGQQNVDTARKHLPALEALRGLAALFVATFHFTYWIFAKQVGNVPIDTGEFANLFLTRAGAFGAEIFFFLSGFIMVYTTRYAKSASSRFFLRRIIRVLPLYWICLGTVYLSSATPISPVDMLKSAFLLPNTNSGPPFFGYGVLFVAWTLSYEMVFYVYFAFALGLSSRTRATAVMVSLALLSSVFGLQLLISGYVTLVPAASPILHGVGVLNALMGLLANPLLVHFAIGALVGEAYSRMGESSWSAIGNLRTLRAAIAMLLVATPILYFGMPNQHGLYGVGASAFSLFVAFAISDLIGEPFNLSAAERMGQWSYGIYLLHPIIAASIEARFPGFWQASSLISSYLLYIAITVLFAGVLHELVERPLMNLARQKLRADMTS